jgi:hypothetical protein
MSSTTSQWTRRHALGSPVKYSVVVSLVTGAIVGAIAQSPMVGVAVAAVSVIFNLVLWSKGGRGARALGDRSTSGGDR